MYYLSIYKPFDDGPCELNIWWLNVTVKVSKPLIFDCFYSFSLKLNLLHCFVDGCHTSRQIQADLDINFVSNMNALTRETIE
jgi:hypothetical protein